VGTYSWASSIAFGAPLVSVVGVVVSESLYNLPSLETCPLRQYATNRSEFGSALNLDVQTTRTVFLAQWKTIFHKNKLFVYSKIPLGRKFRSDSKTGLKKSHTVSKEE
jgi:hypothetical protein